MKKRRELDALVNGSKQSSGARMKSGRHELLRNESESSEVEEFSLTPNTAARKRTHCHCCAACWPACSAFLLVLCICFIGVLFYMNIQLKTEVYQLQNRLQEFQVNLKDIPSRIDTLNGEQLLLNKSLIDLKARGGEVPSLNTAVIALTMQISSINASLNQLKQSPAMMSKVNMQEVLSHYEQLSRNFADIGSRMEAVEKGFETQKQKVRSIITSLQSTTPSPLNGSLQGPSSQLSLTNVQKELQNISAALDSMISMREKLDRLMAETSARQSMLTSLYNKTLSLESRINALQTQSTTNELPPALHAAVTNAVNAEMSSRLRETSLAGVSNLSTAVTEMKQAFDARILALELHDANQTKDIALMAAELNFTKEALNQATSNITDSVQILAHTTESIGMALQAVEEAISDLRSQVPKFVPTATTVIVPPVPQSMGGERTADDHRDSSTHR